MCFVYHVLYGLQVISTVDDLGVIGIRGDSGVIQIVLAIQE